MKIIDAKAYSSKNEFLDEKTIVTARTICSAVQKKGDSEVRKYTKLFDKQSGAFVISKKKISQAYKRVSSEKIVAIKKAAKNITAFAREQRKQYTSFEKAKQGVSLGQKIIPINRAGCYVPGGRYPLPSSALMTIIPAKVAGVKEIIVCSPKIADETIVAADIAGASMICSIGGAQAIAAMAYGTKTIASVDIIVGPGNRYVAAAKKEVYGVVGIDFIAGASELLVIADRYANPSLVAADLLAQAEHDVDARANLIVSSKQFAHSVNEEIQKQLKTLKEKKNITVALKKGRIIIAKTIKEAAKLSNAIAPEHLSLQMRNPSAIMKYLNNYGALFIGENASEVFGDYAQGPNHTLPTNGVARYTGGLSVGNFLKIVTTMKLQKKALKQSVALASTFAEMEGLEAHKRAAQMRNT